MDVPFNLRKSKYPVALLPKIKPLAFGIPIALTGTDNGLGKKVTENTEPFYKKEIVGDNNV